MILCLALMWLSSPCTIHDVRGTDYGVVLALANDGETFCTDLPVSFVCGGTTVDRVVAVVRPEQVVNVEIAITDLGWPDVTGWVELTCVVPGDTLRTWIELPPPPGAVIINEVMFDPRPGRADYVEITSQAAEPVPLRGWTLRDASTSAMIPDSTVVTPGEYTVLASKASVAEMMTAAPAVVSRAINFNTTGDRVALCTSSGFVADELTYSPKWHSSVLSSTRGFSLEKLHPALVTNRSTSWTTCSDTAGGTPGRANSTTRAVPQHGTLHVSPSPFSSDPRSVLHPAVITYRQPFRTARATISIVASDGVRIATLLNSQGIFWQGAVAWDGTSDSGQRVPPGPYIVVLECVDAASSATHQATALIVVGQ